MGDVSIIARRLKDGHVQYGWGGNGGYYRNTGYRLLSWYEDSEDVEYLFSLGQTRLIGKKGSEYGGYKLLESHDLTGEPFWLGTSESDIFSKIMFVDYGYFYDIDENWYYINPREFNVKIPLELIHENLNEEYFEFDFLDEVKDKILRYIFGEYMESDPEFKQYLENEGYSIPKILDDIKENNKLSTYLLYKKYKPIVDYFDEWIKVDSNEKYSDISKIYVKKKTEKHIETCEW